MANEILQHDGADGLARGTLARARDLARQVEELLEDTRSSAAQSSMRAHSTRMARAMAASLVDELDALVAPPRS
jgi:ribosomal protein L17